MGHFICLCSFPRSPHEPGQLWPHPRSFSHGVGHENKPGVTFLPHPTSTTCLQAGTAFFVLAVHLTRSKSSVSWHLIVALTCPHGSSMWLTFTMHGPHESLHSFGQACSQVDRMRGYSSGQRNTSCMAWEWHLARHLCPHGSSRSSHGSSQPPSGLFRTKSSGSVQRIGVSGWRGQLKGIAFPTAPAWDSFAWTSVYMSTFR